MRLKYAFIKQRAGDYSIRRLCLTLKVHPSGYYAWLYEMRFRGLVKNTAQRVTLFALSNLWMARRYLLPSAGEVRL